MSVKALPNGKFRVRVYLGFESGKRRLIDRVVNSKHEAQKLEARLRTQVEDKTVQKPTRLTVEELAERWLEHVETNSEHPTTAKEYRKRLRAHVLPVIGSKRVDRVTPEDVDRVLDAMARAGKAPNTRAAVRSTLSAMFGALVRWKLLRVNPVADSGRVKAQNVRKRHMPDAQEVRTLLDSVRGDRLEAVAYVLAFTGARIGEVLGLKWQDVDLGAGTLTFARSLTTGGPNPVFGPPKGDDPRTLDMAQGLAQALKVHRKRQLEERLQGGPDWNPQDLLFTTTKGTALYPNWVTCTWWPTVLEAAGVDASTNPHALRHAMGTDMAAAGVDPRTIAEILGHKDVRFTLMKYVHPREETRKAAVAARADMLG